MKKIRTIADLNQIEDLELRDNMKKALESVLEELLSDGENPYTIVQEKAIHIAFMENEDDFTTESLGDLNLERDSMKYYEYNRNITTKRGEYSYVSILYNNEAGIFLYSDKSLMEKYLV